MLTEFIIIMFSFANSLSLWPKSQPFDGLTVAPHVGAWIEITYGAWADIFFQVAPHVGAWIEITKSEEKRKNLAVAPHVGAWIEITGIISASRKESMSHPTWVRGLKSRNPL